MPNLDSGTANRLLDPNSIRAKTFSRTWWGYHPAEVHQYLRALAQALEEHRPATPAQIPSSHPASVVEPAESSNDSPPSERPTDWFAQGMELLAAGDYAAAEHHFLKEAHMQEGRFPWRAAIAYRQAAWAAAQRGDHDHFDHWMRLAGREYLKASEDPSASAYQIREAALAAARCFMEVENLPLSTKSLSRAQEIQMILSEPVFFDGSTGTSTPQRKDQAPA